MNTFDPDRAKLSEEVETIFYAHPGQYVREVVVAGVSVGTNAHERLLRAWLVLSKAGEKAGDPAVVDALRRWTERHLVKSKWLHGGIEVVGELPKSSTGKTLRRVLVDDYERRVGVMVKGKL
ncbi:uncharacterized protein BT62DRAFT_930924 [Guyanagaster necrorhizus]|uniref:AMP-binding enzyme C-terminal domain-containing protein n=1 Tax=Guyanagaster necrorhizus TaxID=856835 RepID=A0A9P7VV16_9AGAR|nr:uncharacterized protein BT62DRAFT_930924 [Guyanagaster necrorhizus MCA 3950]KAG7447087.1 hypothetical protein BT62DRAFT_930924 [Guyanagaster necrorhizus MCA 3950]